VTYAGVNPADYKRVDNLTRESAYPFILGFDFAGVLESTPPAERELRPGDRVFGMSWTHGTYAEHTVVQSQGKGDALARIPETVPDDQAAALPVAGITALGAVDFSEVGRGQWFVVMGATGGVGGYAVQLAKAQGADVIATVRGGADEAVRLGADEVYDSAEVDVFDAIKERHPDGVEAVLDAVNDADAIARDAEILKSGGRLVSTLFAADGAWFAERGISAENFSSSASPLASRAGLNELASFLGTGAITPRVTTTAPLRDSAVILAQLRHGGVHGKAVIRI
jgi:NADPH:quinone reductase-like Zn-dependent oxidoreductase